MSDLDGVRELYEVFNPRPVVDTTALAAATDSYSLEVGEVDDLAFATAVLVYLETVWELGYLAARKEAA